MFQIFTAEQADIEIEGFTPGDSTFSLDPAITFWLSDDGTVAVYLPVVWGGEEEGFWHYDNTAPVAPVTFSKPVIFEQEDGSRGSIFMCSTDGSAELRYIAQESPLGQALLARGLVSVQPA